jgi:hypothetical protein
MLKIKDIETMRELVLALVFGVLLLIQVKSYGDDTGEGEPKSPKKNSSWLDNVLIKGDFRYRHETIKEEDITERNRERIRARVGADAKINENISLIFRLATCSSPDPTSTSQTLGDGFSHKSIWLDLAYFDMQPMKGLSLLGGKMTNPFVTPGRSDLIWDAALTPEGLAAKYSLTFGSIEPFMTVGNFCVEERALEPDSFLVAGQVGLGLKLGDGADVKFGVSYFDYQRARGYSPFYDATEGFGNTLDAGGNYAHGFDELEGFAEFGFKVCKIPILIFADCVGNHEASKDNKGWLAGFGIGKPKEPGDWSVYYNYRRLEKDAVIGAFTGSDPWGGGTNGKGSKVCFEIMIANNTTLSAIGFLTKKDLDNEKDYKRFQIDIMFKF